MEKLTQKLDQMFRRTGDPVLDRQESLLFLYSITVFVVLACYSLLFELYFESTPVALWCLGLGFMAGSSYSVFRASKSWEVACGTLLFSGTLTIAVAAYYTGGFESPSLVWTICVPLVAGLLLDKKAIIYWSGVSALVIFSLYLAESIVGQIPLGIDESKMPVVQVLALAGPLFMVGYFTLVFTNKHQTVITHLQDKEFEVTRLLQVVSHDIANPLSLISIFCKLSKKMGGYNEKQLETWAKVNRAADTIEKILNEVRQFQALKAGKMTAKREPVDIAASVDHAKFIFQEMLKNKSLEIVFDNPSRGELKITAEHVMFENQILNNLISNAIKFSEPNKKIIIRVSKEDSRIHIEVSDSGIGMPKEILENVFAPGKNTSRKGTNGEIGTGFGMPLVKSYVELFSGDINIESKCVSEYPDDHGSTVHLYFDAAA